MKYWLSGILSVLIGVGGFAAGTGGGDFGHKDPGLLNLKGNIYFLAEGTEGLPPDLEQRKPDGTIYTDRLDVPARAFTEGFPGISNRFEWFGLIYTGTFEIAAPGAYKWRLSSDDGSRLWVDGREVVQNDGVHPEESQEAEQDLTAGVHAIKVWFFQGPAETLALQLFITPPGGEERIFSLADYSPNVTAAARRLDAQATPEGIRIKLDAQILFDTAKFDLKPAAREVIAAVVQLIRSYPGCRVRIEGHTDSVGEDGYNLKLSEDRARSVRDALAAAGLPADVRFEIKGFGKTRPVAPNDTEPGRAQNRRVELLIVP